MENNKATELASQLIGIKMQIRELSKYEQILKEELKSFLHLGEKIQLKAGHVSYSERKGAETFSRKDVLDYIQKHYGDIVANQIDRDCTHHSEPKQIIYVTLCKDVE